MINPEVSQYDTYKLFSRCLNCYSKFKKFIFSNNEEINLAGVELLLSCVIL